MSPSVRVLKLETAIKEQWPKIDCDIRVSEVSKGLVVTVALWSIGPVREVSAKQRHEIHMLIAQAFEDALSIVMT